MVPILLLSGAIHVHLAALEEVVEGAGQAVPVEAELPQQRLQIANVNEYACFLQDLVQVRAAQCVSH
jgi:hypothetical protein